MLTSPDFLEDSKCRHILNVAPDRPLSIFRDKYCEELAYPGIFLGQPRTQNRRAAMCVENIFYKTKKL